MDSILKYFPDLAPRQREQFAALEGLYREWNAKINVVSRKDPDEFCTRHVLHSLAIARICPFEAGSRVLDVGTGGGFPAVPLAIMFPEVHFTAVDSIGKKIAVVRDIARQADLSNLDAVNARAENVAGRFDYTVSRAVAPAATILGWVWDKTDRGVLMLKGGELAEELALTRRKYECFDISELFDEEFFETKKVIYVAK